MAGCVRRRISDKPPSKSFLKPRARMVGTGPDESFATGLYTLSSQAPFRGAKGQWTLTLKVCL